LRLLFYLEQLCGFEREPRFLRSADPHAHTNERRKHVRPTIASPQEPEPTRPRQTLPFGLAPGKGAGASKADAIIAKLKAAVPRAAMAELLVEPVLDDTSSSVLFWVRKSSAVGCCARGTTVPDTDLRRMVVSLAD